MIELKTSAGITIQIDDVTQIIDLMGEDDKAQLIESLSCYDDVLSHVAGQISSLYGSTENGHSGWQRCSNSSITGNGSVLDNIRYMVAKSSSAVADELIERQSREINKLNEKINKLENEKWGIFE